MINLRNGIADVIGITVPNGDKVSAFLLLPEVLENNLARYRIKKVERNQRNDKF